MINRDGQDSQDFEIGFLVLILNILSIPVK